ncbi:RNA polymerase sigma factor [Caulifigura coniformis]|uniref:RNA polymerase sigma factor n=1 Tax=Caulifigura coniformis TaxID=2527983 RepID=A0A517SAY6_9PLAN|nr:sigma-70 family RNA polymerase sigma factor [Caulifigura coniformis]QDT53301.1 RNA polymerase sigma factor [Caulifigura coniformis]
MRRRFADTAETSLPVVDGFEEGVSSGEEARQAEFLGLYTRNYRSVYGLLLAFVADPAAADDLMQQTSMLLWAKYSEFDGEGEAPHEEFGRWARTIARNVARNFRRLQHSRPVIFDDDLLAKIAWTRAAADELLELRRGALKSCLKHLPAADAALLQACYGGNSNPAEQAAGSGRTRDAVYKALRRIRVRLYRCVSHRLHQEER